MLAAKDISKVLVAVPQGAWVALSKDEERIVAFGDQLQEVLTRAKEAGESDPVITRVPEANSDTLVDSRDLSANSIGESKRGVGIERAPSTRSC